MLKREGYAQDELFQFEQYSPTAGAIFFSNQGEFWGNRYGGPMTHKPVVPRQASIPGSSGQTYTYLQFVSADQENCRLLFYGSEDGENKLLRDIDVSKLNNRINRVFTSAADLAYPVPLFCLPTDWGDINKNGLPDIAVTILWANNYTGGEVHIFEITVKDEVVDLTKDLPGAMAHWDFDPKNSAQLVIDLAWAKHDCLYPQSPFSFWVFDWDKDKYRDYTASGEFNFSGYVSALRKLVEQRYGNPFDPTIDIGPIVSALLMYDKVGQRDQGWSEFLKMTDLKNWPGTDASALKWLNSDIAHLTREYSGKRPFTPNNFCTQ
jgi:hypothetical protein